MKQGAQSPEYEGRLRTILAAGDWEALREFARSENDIPDDVYEKDRHFWEVLLHKLVLNRLDMLAQHAASREWLEQHGYSGDLGAY